MLRDRKEWVLWCFSWLCMVPGLVVTFKKLFCSLWCSCRQLCEVPPLQTEAMKDSERLGWILAKELWLHGPE